MQNPISLRLAVQTDAADILAIYGPYCDETAVSFEAHAPDLSEIERRIEDVSRQYPWLVAMSGDRVVGYAYASPHRSRAAYQWATEVSVYIHPEFRRQGLAASLYEALFEILRMQGYAVALAGIALPNPASVALHVRLGFNEIALYPSIGFKLGKWHDVVWLEKRLLPVLSAPKPLIAMVELVNKREVNIRLTEILSGES